ncbi:MAG: hypothetical protein PHQ27_08190 [Victivallales bacterium]|nr:hypothetical protein [Victivallales bacterium]
MIEITTVMRRAVATAADFAGGQRALERQLGLASGKVSRLIAGQIRTVTPATMRKLEAAIAAVAMPDPIPPAPHPISPAPVTRLIIARATTLGKLLGRIEATLEVIRNDYTEDWTVECDIIAHAATELYGTAMNIPHDREQDREHGHE